MQIIVEGIALAAFGLIHQYSTEPLIKEITRYVMADEARHVAFGALSLAGVYDEHDRRRAPASARTSWWRRRGSCATGSSPPRCGSGWASRSTTACATRPGSPMLQLFQRILFAKITPNLRKIGLLTPDLHARLRGHRRDGARRPRR